MRFPGHLVVNINTKDVNVIDWIDNRTVKTYRRGRWRFRERDVQKLCLKSVKINQVKTTPPGDRIEIGEDRV